MTLYVLYYSARSAECVQYMYMSNRRTCTCGQCQCCRGYISVKREPCEMNSWVCKSCVMYLFSPLSFYTCTLSHTLSHTTHVLICTHTHIHTHSHNTRNTCSHMHTHTFAQHTQCTFSHVHTPTNTHTHTHTLTES